MRPAFSSTKQGAAFALLLLVVLSLPALLGKNLLPDRRQVYSSIPWGIGAFPFLEKEIFDEKSDVDIAFMGSSPIWWGVDTPYVQEKLSAKLGRPAVVRSLCWNWPGFDPLYFISKDLLEHRKVRMIVFCDLSPGAPSTAHCQASQWFRFRDDPNALDELSLRTKTTFYSGAILGAPRNLLGMLRDNLPVIESDTISWPGFPNVENPARRLGSLTLRMRQNAVFEDFLPQQNADRSVAEIYSENTKPLFRFSNDHLLPTQEVFVKRFAALARQHGVKVVYLHTPRIAEMRSEFVGENVFWPELLGPDAALLGIPPAQLFKGLSDDDVQKLYYDFQHFNENGRKFFAPAITPSLVEMFARL